MDTVAVSRKQVPTLVKTPAMPQPRCPVCGGPCVPTGRTWRCTRCRFSICEGCEAGEVASLASMACEIR
jgi:tRNA(Ile2) C34 agmatinyltransferase TiaS